MFEEGHNIIMSMNVKTTDGVVTVYADNTRLARYQADTSASKPYFDVVGLPAKAGELAGRNLVLAAPHDHVHHLGLFFTPMYVNEVNCWVPAQIGNSENTYGYTLQNGLDTWNDGHGVVIEQTNRWVTTDDAHEILEDRRKIRFQPSQDDSYFITWDQHLTAINETRRLHCESVPTHFSGLNLRFIRSMNDGQIRLPQAAEEESKNGLERPWCDYTGALDGKVQAQDPWRAGITIMDHPENPNHPNGWFNMNSPFGFLSANPMQERTVTLEKNESVTWKWGLWVHNGEQTVGEISNAYEIYQSQSSN